MQTRVSENQRKGENHQSLASHEEHINNQSKLWLNNQSEQKTTLVARLDKEDVVPRRGSQPEIRESESQNTLTHRTVADIKMQDDITPLMRAMLEHNNEANYNSKQSLDFDTEAKRITNIQGSMFAQAPIKNLNVPSKGDQTPITPLTQALNHEATNLSFKNGLQKMIDSKIQSCRAAMNNDTLSEHNQNSVTAKSFVPLNNNRSPFSLRDTNVIAATQVFKAI